MAITSSTAPEGFEWYQPPGRNSVKKLRPKLQPGAPGTQTSGIPTIEQRYPGGSSFGVGQRMFDEFSSRLGAKPFSQIKEMPEEYFRSVKEGLMADLTNQFFGKGGKFEGAMAAESAAGRLGSPVARRILQETVSEPFMEQSRQIGRDVFQQQMESRDRIQQLNADFNLKYNDLSYRISQAERGVLSQEQVAQLDADLRAYEAQLDAATKQAATAAEIDKALMEDYRRGQELGIEFLRTPLEYGPETEGVASRLSTQFGGSPISGAPGPVQSNQPFEPNYPGKTTPEYNALPAQGSFTGEIIRVNGRNYAWNGPRLGWTLVYS